MQRNDQPGSWVTLRLVFVRQWFLVGLAVVLGLGFVFPATLQPLGDSRNLRAGIVATVMFVTALSLETTRMWSAVRSPRAVLLASLCNYVVVPLLAWIASPMLTRDFSIGLLIIAAAPCTMVSAAVWTRRAGGDDATAIMVTITTSLVCFLVAPLWLLITTGQQHVELDFSDMVWKLCLLVVCPIAVAQILRQWQPIEHFARANKGPLGITAQLGILTIVFMGAVKCGQQLSGSELNEYLGIWDYGVMALTVLAVHAAALLIGFRLAKAFGIERAGQIAVGIAGSQKTLMVALHVGLNYYGGLTILPMVAYHVGQLLIDTLVADFLTRRR